MARHETVTGLVKEAISEYLFTAEWCVKYVKSASWGPGQAGGCLGYPGAALMFCIADTIGSYHRGNEKYQFMIDGESRHIKGKGFQHFYILNSDYYALSMTENDIKDIYDKYRNLLVHNSALAPGAGLVMLPNDPQPFVAVPERGLCFNVGPFLELTKRAVQLFMARADDLVPGSAQDRVIQKKAGG